MGASLLASTRLESESASFAMLGAARSSIASDAAALSLSRDVTRLALTEQPDGLGSASEKTWGDKTRAASLAHRQATPPPCEEMARAASLALLFTPPQPLAKIGCHNGLGELIALQTEAERSRGKRRVPQSPTPSSEHGTEAGSSAPAEALAPAPAASSTLPASGRALKRTKRSHDLLQFQGAIDTGEDELRGDGYDIGPKHKAGRNYLERAAPALPMVMQDGFSWWGSSTRAAAGGLGVGDTGDAIGVKEWQLPRAMLKEYNSVLPEAHRVTDARLATPEMKRDFASDVPTSVKSQQLVRELIGSLCLHDLDSLKLALSTHSPPCLRDLHDLHDLRDAPCADGLRGGRDLGRDLGSYQSAFPCAQ